VDVLSIAAGNNNIGNVDVVTLPALPAGTNNIGDVDVLSSALPTGAATSAAQATGNTALAGIQTAVEALDNAVAGSELQVDVVAALPAGNNNVGDVDVASIAAGNNNIGDVDVASVVPGTGATSLGKAEDAAHTTGDVGAMALAVRRDANTTLAGTDGDYAPLQVNADGSLKVAITAGAGSGGTSATDDAAFTVASGSGTPVMGMLDDTSPDVVDEGDVGVARMTPYRSLHVNLRDASGNELSVGAQYAEDAAHADANQLMMAGAVRRDSPTSSTATDGDNATLTTDTEGRMWVNAGQVAHDAAVAGRPVHTAGVATSSEQTAVASGDVVYSSHTLSGKQLTQPYSTRPNFWRYAAPAGGLVNTTGVTAKAAPPAGSRNCITSIQVMNTHQTTSTEIEVRDGAAGTVLWRGWAQAGGGGAAANLPVPICGTNTTLIEIAEVTTTATNGVLVNMQGYVSAD